jgi:hypothetical protein
MSSYSDVLSLTIGTLDHPQPVVTPLCKVWREIHVGAENLCKAVRCALAYVVRRACVLVSDPVNSAAFSPRAKVPKQCA